MYHHTQPGSVIRIPLLIGIGILVLVGWVIYRDGQTETLTAQELMVTYIGLALGAFVLLLLLALFHSLTVYEDHEALYIRFGIGFFSKRIPFDRIVDCQAVRNSGWMGWGIRKLPKGSMWNVAGLDAVELTFKDGSKFRIGTDEPDALATAINLRLRK